MKRVLFILLCVCIPILSGCWDRVEMHDLAIITAAAIDKVEDDKIRISVQIFIPRTITSGETGEDPSSGSTFVREGVGDNLANAIAMLQVNVPRTLFWGQCKIFIFGNELAELGIRKEIDFLARHSGPRGGSFMYVSDGEAKDILTLIPPLERYSGEALSKLTQEEVGMVSTLRDVDIGFMGEGKSVSMPFIKKLESKDGARKPNETIPVFEGTAIFNRDQMVGTLSITETHNLLWLKNMIKKETISVSPEGEDGEITMQSSLGKVKERPLIKDGRWNMNVDVLIEGDIVQNETHLDLMNEHVLQKLNKEYEMVLQERLEQIVDKLQQEFKVDVIDFGRKFHQKYPKEWKEVRDHWEEKFPEVEVKINVDATIKSPGYIGPPAALPIDEVKE